MNQQTTHSAKGSILVVDDTHDNLRLLNGMLTRQGYTVRPVPDGDLALVSARKSAPDLILLDIMMPNLSGYDVCRQLKADAQTRDIPIIFISALNEVFDKVKAFSLGGVDYITKPFQMEEVLARVETHLMLRNLNKELQQKNTQLQHEVAERTHAEDSLKHSLSRIERAKQEWESTADSLVYVVCLLDRDGRIVRSNRTVEHWNLSAVTNINGRSLHDVFHPACEAAACPLQGFLEQAWQQVARGDMAETEMRDAQLHRYLQFQIRPIAAAGSISAAASEAESFAVACIHDISTRKRAEASMRQRNYELAMLNQMTSWLQTCHSETDTYQVLGDICKQLFPTDSGHLYMLDQEFGTFEPVMSWGRPQPEDGAFSVHDCWCVCNGTSFLVPHPGEAPLCGHLAGSPQHGYVCAPIDTSDRRPGVVHLRFGEPEPGYSEPDIRHALELKRMSLTRITEHYAVLLSNLRLRETLRREAIRDPLTELYNRRYMEESLQREVRRARRNHSSIGIVMLDIDHFKRLNDTYGHKIGDVALQTLAHLLQSHVRGGDIACRYGGEEFLLILPEADQPATRARAEQLVQEVRNLRLAYHDEALQLTASCGVAVFADQNDDMKAVIEQADLALYQAKKRGRNQVASIPQGPSSEAASPPA